MLLSSAKSYLSGYRPKEDNTTFPSFRTMDTDAVRELQRLALVGSRPFLIGVVGVVGVLVLLLGVIVWGVEVERLQTFELKNVVEVLEVR